MDLNEQRSSDGSVVISVSGEVDLATAPQLRGLLLRTIENDDHRLTTIDFAGCTFIDSTALCVLFEAGQLLDVGLRRLRICNLHGQPRSLFQMTMMDRLPEIEILESDAPYVTAMAG